MTKHSEILTTEAQHRESTRCLRIRPRATKQLSRLDPNAQDKSEKEESKPRFRVDSVESAVKQDPPTFPMRVLLRNAKTMKFFRSAEHWTKNPKRARDFHNGWWATLCAFTMNPSHLVIHYEFEDDRYNLHIPVLGHSRT